MDCGHGWRNDADCDICRPPAIVVAGLRGRITELEAELAAVREWMVHHPWRRTDAGVAVRPHLDKKIARITELLFDDGPTCMDR